MAGKAVVTARMAQLDTIGEEEIFHLYLEHGSVPALCRELFKPQSGDRPGTQAFYDWLHATPERWAAWQKLKLTRAEVEVDLALDEASSATKDNVAEKRLKVDTHKWRAGIFNRDYRSGQSAVQVNVGVQVGNAWLEALSKVGETIKAEVVE